MRIVTINGGKMTSKLAVHEHIAEALDFPLYYGKNLDALADCLSELPRDTVVIFFDMDEARKNLGDYADQIYGVFDEFAQEGVFKLLVGDMN